MLVKSRNGCRVINRVRGSGEGVTLRPSMSHGGSGEPERVISLDDMTADRNDMRCSHLKRPGWLRFAALP